MPKFNRRTKIREGCIIVGIFIVVLSVNYLFSITTTTDSRWVSPVAMSILREGNIDLNEYQNIFKEKGFFGIENVNGKYYNSYPIGTSIVALPVTYSFYLFQNNFENLEDFYILDKVISSFILAWCAILAYLVFRKLLSIYPALLLMLIFVFCTGIWPIVGVSLWQHGPSVMMILISLYILIAAKENPSLIKYLGLPLVFSLIIRPTNIISLVVLTIYVFLYYRKYFSAYAIFSSLLIILFIGYNITIYNSLLAPYYLANYLTGAYWGEALIGNLFSPSRGLFIFSPILLFCIWGIIWQFKKQDKLSFYLFFIILIHWVVISFNNSWWAGYSFGPRLFTEVLPYFFFFLIFAFQYYLRLNKDFRRQIISYLVMLLIVVSFLINLSGATNLATFGWNFIPNDIDHFHNRVWDWQDPQFLRGVNLKIL